MAAPRRTRPPGGDRAPLRPGRRRGAALAVLATLAVPLMVGRAAPAAAAPAVLLRASAPEEYLAAGMPLSARRAYLALPAAGRRKCTAVPGLLEALSRAGHGSEALSLFAEAQKDLAGPSRARAFLAVGKIHWGRKDFAKAAAAFREAAGIPGAAPEATLYLARLQASGGNVAGALHTLSGAPPGEKKAAVAAAIERLRKRTDVDALRAAAGATKAGTSAHAVACAALSRALLERGEHRGALDAAREGIAGTALRRDAAGRSSAWDGTRTAADEAWAAAAALFPDGADAGAFFAAGGAFFAAADLADAARATANGVRESARRTEGARRALARTRGTIDGAARRAEEIRARYRAREDAAGRLRSRAREAAETLALSAWGATTDPRGTALLGRLDRDLAALGERLERTRAGVDAAARENGRRAPAPEDRRMLLFVRAKMEKAAEEFRAVEGRAAFLRGRIRNRWKAMYVARLSDLLDGADRARTAARDGAARAIESARPAPSARAETEQWERAAARYSARLAADAGVLASLRERARGAAERALGAARQDLARAIAREERSLHYLAARAATGILVADKGAGASAAPGARAALLAEARGHWEASLPPPGETGETADEALYALAEIGFEETEARYYGAARPPQARPDYTASAALFRRVVEEYPASPYAEPAHYGLALCLQEMGAPDNSAAVLAAMLARYPGTRYADETHLRLAEDAFDRADYRLAEEQYRKVGAAAPADIRATAQFKLGWTLFLTERFRESVDPFLAALLAAPEKGKAGVSAEALRMTARALVDAGMEDGAEALLAARGAAARGPALLLEVQEILGTQNRYDDVVRVADRLGAAYPVAGERIDAEAAAAEALRKGGRGDDAFARRGTFHALFGPGSRWQAAPGRTPGEIARADLVAEEGLRGAATHFHRRTREAVPGPGGKTPPSRDAVLALYDAHAALFPASPKAGEIAYQRAWLLFEAGRKRDAGAAFEAVARRPDPGRGESSLYMAVQCAKDAAAASEAGPPEGRAAALAEVIRLGDAYERAFPAGDRLAYVLLDRARASYGARRFREAAGDAGRAASMLSADAARREALRLSGDAMYGAGDYGGAEKAFRALAGASPPPAERNEAEKWIGFSMFRRAETLPRERAAEAAGIFAGLAREFPSLDIAPTALFRAGAAAADAGRTKDAVAAFLAVESGGGDPALARDATRWLATLYEKTGDGAAAADRYERLAASGPAGGKRDLLLRAAALLSGIDPARARKDLVAVAALPDSPPTLRVTSLYRAAESARGEGKDAEAEALYEKTTAAHQAAPDAAPEIAGKAYLARAEARFARYRSLAIVPPLEKTFAEKRAALEAAAGLFIEAIRVGDAETVPAALHRLGEGFEDFRAAILASPPPRGLSDREREEYVFLLEEKAAPIEEKAVDAYQRNVRQAVAAGVSSAWVNRSFARLRALRPARFARRWEYAFPVVPVPDFVGIIVRTNP